MFFREGRPWQGPFRLYCGLGLPTRLGCPASPATASAKRAKTVFHRLLCALPRQNFAGPSMPTLVYIILLYCDGWLWAIAALSTSRHKLFRVRIFRGHLVGRFLGQNAALFPFPATPSSPAPHGCILRCACLVSGGRDGLCVHGKRVIALEAPVTSTISLRGDLSVAVPGCNCLQRPRTSDHATQR